MRLSGKKYHLHEEDEINDVILSHVSLLMPTYEENPLCASVCVSLCFLLLATSSNWQHCVCVCVCVCVWLCSIEMYSLMTISLLTDVVLAAESLGL